MKLCGWKFEQSCFAGVLNAWASFVFALVLSPVVAQVINFNNAHFANKINLGRTNLIYIY